MYLSLGFKLGQADVKDGVTLGLNLRSLSQSMNSLTTLIASPEIRMNGALPSINVNVKRFKRLACFFLIIIFFAKHSYL